MNNLTSSSNWVVIGAGNQGKKHIGILGSKCLSVIDCATFAEGEQLLRNLNSGDYGNVLISTPESVKGDYIVLSVGMHKNILVEKPAPMSSYHTDLLQRHLSAGYKFSTSYDHEFDAGVKEFVRMVRGIRDSESVSWSELRINYDFGTRELIQNSRWMDFGSGPWELIGPHIHKLALSIGDMDSNGLQFSYGYSTLKCPTSVTAYQSGNHKIELHCSYVSWENRFSVKFYWENGLIKLEGLTKWGESRIQRFERTNPVGVPVIKDEKTFSATPIDYYVAASHKAFNLLSPSNCKTEDDVAIYHGILNSRNLLRDYTP